MRTRETFVWCHPVLAAMLGAFLIALHVQELGFEKVIRSVNSVEVTSQPIIEDFQTLDYKVWRVFTEDKKGFTVVVVKCPRK